MALLVRDVDFRADLVCISDPHDLSFLAFRLFFDASAGGFANLAGSMDPHQGLVPSHEVLVIRRNRNDPPLRVLSLHCVCWHRFDRLILAIDHFQQHPEAKTCNLMIKTSSWLFVVGTGVAESRCLFVIICISVVLIRCLLPSHANRANMGCLEQRPTTEHRSPDILPVVLGTNNQDRRHVRQVNRG
jgi:hypothetical protein